jgi:hypothetical protein
MSILPMLRKGFIPAMIYGGICLTGCSHKMAPEGHFQETPVVADGSAGDWTLPLRFSNETYTLQYTVTNDNQNLYVCVLSNDYATQLRILKTGMSIYFDPKGEKNRTIGIVYPIKKQADPDNYRNRNGNPVTAADSKTRKEELLLQSDYYNTIGFPNMENGQFSVNDRKNNIQLAMKLNNNDSVLVYEVVIPIRSILGDDLGPKTQYRNFSVGIVLNPVPGQGGNNGGGSRPGGFGGMRGGMMGMRGGMGGMGGGGRRGGSGGSAAVKEEADWYSFRFAKKS